MAKNDTVSACAQIVAILKRLKPDERLRAVQAALTLVGEARIQTPKSEAPLVDAGEGAGDGAADLPPRVRAWLRQNELDAKLLSHAFHIEGDSANFIGNMPGKDLKEKTINSYVVAGLTRFLASGETKFDDKSARALCETAGCYDATNHTKRLKEKGNRFTGSKSAGWALTIPGLTYAATLVKAIGPKTDA